MSYSLAVYNNKSICVNYIWKYAYLDPELTNWEITNVFSSAGVMQILYYLIRIAQVAFFKWHVNVDGI